MLDLSQPEVAREIEQLLDDEASKAQIKVPKYTLKLKDITKQYAALQDKGEAWAVQLARTSDIVSQLRREVAYLEARKDCWDEVVGEAGQEMLHDRLRRLGKKGSRAGRKRKPIPNLMGGSEPGSGRGGSASNKGAVSKPSNSATRQATVKYSHHRVFDDVVCVTRASSGPNACRLCCRVVPVAQQAAVAEQDPPKRPQWRKGIMGIV